jgi:hypothetical protein
MADVFQGEMMKYGGGFRSDMGMFVDTAGVSGKLMQNIQITYQRPITKIFELGKSGDPVGVYYVEGRPNGNLTLGRIIGFGREMMTFYTKFGAACNAGDNTMSLDLNNTPCPPVPGAPPVVPARIQIKLTYCVLTSVGLSVNAQQLVINENCSMEFTNMEYL